MAEIKSYKSYFSWKYVPFRAAAIISDLLFIDTSTHHARFPRPWLGQRREFIPPSLLDVSACTGSNPTNTELNTNTLTIEIISYIARAKAHSRTNDLMLYVIQDFLSC